MRAPEGPWERCMTINDSWGFRHQDTNYKSVRQLVRYFAETIGMGGNLLLDVGPREDGTIPQEQVDRLEGLGRWIATHSAAVHGTVAGLPPGHHYLAPSQPTGGLCTSSASTRPANPSPCAACVPQSPPSSALAANCPTASLAATKTSLASCGSTLPPPPTSTPMPPSWPSNSPANSTSTTARAAPDHRPGFNRLPPPHRVTVLSSPVTRWAVTACRQRTCVRGLPL